MFEKRYLLLIPAALAGLFIYSRYNAASTQQDGGYYAGEAGIDGAGGVSSYAAAPSGGNSYPLMPQNALTDTGVNSGLDNYAGADTSSFDMGAMFDKLLTNNKELGLANIDFNKAVVKSEEQVNIVTTLSDKLGVNQAGQLQFNPDGTIAGVVKRAIRGPKYYDTIVSGLTSKINGVLKQMEPVETNLSKWEVQRSTVQAQIAATPANKTGALKTLQNKLAKLDENIAGAKTRLTGFNTQLDLYNTDKTKFSSGGSALDIGALGIN